MQEDKNGFIVSSSISFIVEILFYNKVTNSLIFIGLHAQVMPSGQFHYEYEFHRPIPITPDDFEHNLLNFLEYSEIVLVVLYILSELYVYYNLVYLYRKEKKIKKEKNI